jgi:hypothetical protein
VVQVESTSQLPPAVATFPQPFVFKQEVGPTRFIADFRDWVPFLAVMVTALSSWGSLRRADRTLRDTREFNTTTLRMKANEDERKEILRQLHSFYGPVRLLALRTKRLRAELGRKQPPGFRLLLALVESGITRFDENDRAVIAILVESTAELNRLLQTNVALVESERLLEVLQKTSVHFSLLKAAYEGKLRAEAVDGHPRFSEHVFPDELHEEIEKAIRELREQLNKL